MQSGSILNRKLKPHSHRNDTSLNSEYEKEQSQLEARRSRTQSLGEQRRVALFGSAKERAALQQRVNEDANFQLVIKEQLVKEQVELDKRQNEMMEQHRLAMLELEQAREQQRKACLRQVQEENRLAALAKARENLHMKVVEDRRDYDSTLQNIANYHPNVF
jgi:hypothetical protein